MKRDSIAATVPAITDAWIVNLLQKQFAYDRLLERFEELLGIDFVDRLSMSIADVVLDAVGYPPTGTIAATDSQIFEVSRDWFYDYYCENISTGTANECQIFLDQVRTDPRVSMHTTDIRMVGETDTIYHN